MKSHREKRDLVLIFFFFFFFFLIFFKVRCIDRDVPLYTVRSLQLFVYCDEYVVVVVVVAFLCW